MNKDQRHSIDILDRCLNLQVEDDQDFTRQQRFDELIAGFATRKRPAVAVAVGWHFCVPESFRAALDITLTPRMIDGRQTMKWTQGSWFHFEEGDKLYDSPEAYDKWDLNSFHVCIDIRKASPAKPEKSNQSKREPGTVIFDVWTPNSEGTKLVNHLRTTLSQDEFIRMLILGPPREWADFAPTKREREPRLLF